MQNTNQPVAYKTQEQSGKIQSSIANRLSGKMFLRLLGLFFSINILICLIACFTLFFYSETSVANAAEKLPNYSEASSGNVNVHPLTEPPANRSFHFPLIRRFVNQPDVISRSFSAVGDGFHKTIRSIDYIINVGYGNQMYELRINIGVFLIYFIYAFFVLLFFEFITLISQTANDGRMIRKTLRPIAELARTAQSLNQLNAGVTPQSDNSKITALPGFLDKIDAERLDTRIQIDGLQDELKNVAIAINGMLDRINESYAAQARFVSDASHELRTPIAVIQGYANLLDRWGTDDEKTLKESIAAIKDESESMNELVEQLLFLARGDSNRINMVLEDIELLELVTEVVNESRLIDDTHEYKISCENISVSADKGLLKQALRILVDNAAKYTDKNGEIKISALQDGKSARLSVSDSGIGIKPEILPNVFNRFVRADESRTRATGGAGLGLSIAEWIVSKHNGYMEVLSREDIGTKITIVLPAVSKRTPAAPQKPNVILPDTQPTSESQSLPELI